MEECKLNSLAERKVQMQFAKCQLPTCHGQWLIGQWEGGTSCQNNILKGAQGILETQVHYSTFKVYAGLPQYIKLLLFITITTFPIKIWGRTRQTQNVSPQSVGGLAFARLYCMSMKIPTHFKQLWWKRNFVLEEFLKTRKTTELRDPRSTQVHYPLAFTASPFWNI